MADLTFDAVAALVAGMPRDAISGARWFGGKGREITTMVLDEAFDLGSGTGLAVVEIRDATGERGRYTLPVAVAAGALVVAGDGAGTWRALAVAVAEGRTIPSLPRRRVATPALGPVSAALVCRPAAAIGAVAGTAARIRALDERSLGVDQSNTSVVLGESLLLKAYRRLEEGLNPDLELTAYLSEEVGFEAVPRLAGYVELVSTAGASTVAMLQEFVAGADTYEATAEQLTAWILAPGEVTVEFATEQEVDLGSLTAELHAALAAARGIPDFEPRDATARELRDWHRAAVRQLQRAIDVTTGAAGEELRGMAPAIAEQLTVLEAAPTVPLVTRVHGDYHLGQIVAAPGGYRIVDFEGEPTRPLAERRNHSSPLRDVASMLRSIDHVARSARRRAEARRGGTVESPGLDIDAFLVRARARFLAAYRGRLRELGAPIAIDEDLLRAFEFEKECYEFIYAATYLPEWTWAPLEGMRALVAEAAAGGP